jgi:hypothetical protein
MAAGQATATLKIPVSPFQLFLALGFLVSLMFSFAQTVLLLRQWKK